MPLTVLYVCTGNVCRSPMAQRIFLAGMGPHAAVRVSSAGTAALVGSPMDPASASALAQLGVEPGGHQAQQFEPWMTAQADLVLTADRAHRDLVMTELPTAFRRTFTMREFVRLANHVVTQRNAAITPEDVIAQVAAARGLTGVVDTVYDNMPDPYQRPIRLAMEVAALISRTVQATITVLGLQPQDQPQMAGSPRGRQCPGAPAGRRPLPYRS